MKENSGREVLHSLNRKLTILRGERKAAVRRDILDGIMCSKTGEMVDLARLLGLKKEQ
ncbi:MAG: hypothetical protein ACTSPB_02995 [Candidatus Thorarchaeota archaeon]